MTSYTYINKLDSVQNEKGSLTSSLVPFMLTINSKAVKRNTRRDYTAVYYM